MSMSLSGVSSPLEQEPNSHAFFIGCVTKYCLIVFIVPISIITRIFPQIYKLFSIPPNISQIIYNYVASLNTIQ